MIATVTNYHKFNSMKHHKRLISQFCKSQLAQLGSLLWVSQGQSQGVGWLDSYGKTLEKTYLQSRDVGRIQLCVAVALRSCFPDGCWLGVAQKF